MAAAQIAHHDKYLSINGYCDLTAHPRSFCVVVYQRDGVDFLDWRERFR